MVYTLPGWVCLGKGIRFAMREGIYHINTRDGLPYARDLCHRQHNSLVCNPRSWSSHTYSTVTKRYGAFLGDCLLFSLLNSLAPGRFQLNFRWVIFKLILVNGGCDISFEIALRWMPLGLTVDKWTLVQVMAWCRHATSHYLSKCWPRYMSPNGVTKPQWVLMHWIWLWNPAAKCLLDLISAGMSQINLNNSKYCNLWRSLIV